LDSSRYFAAAPPDEIGPSVAARLEEVVKDFQFQDREATYRRLFDTPLGLQSSGDVGQLIKVHVPKAKPLLQSLVGLILGPPLTWRPSARNADVESRGSVQLAANLLEYFWREEGLATFCAEWVRAGFAFREAYVLPEWDASKGRQVGVDPVAGQLVLSGGLSCRLIMPWDVFFDCEYRSYEELPWKVVRTYENRWDLAALNQAKADAIIKSSGTFLAQTNRRVSQSQSHDVVPKYTLFHRPCPAVPDGLRVVFLDGQTVLSVEPLSEVPLERFAPSTRLDTPFGDSSWEGTLAIEEMTDEVESALATNLNQFGTQALAMASNAVPTKDRTNNLAIFEVPPGTDASRAVAPLQLTRQPEGADKWLSQKASDMAFATGQNDVQLGQPDTAQMNARAFAILKSAATERNSVDQRRALDAIGRLGAKVCRLLADNMTEEQALSIGGRASRLNYPAKRFSGKDLEPIATCFVEVGNPLEQTAAGRLELFQMYAETGAVKTPEDVQQIVETGRLEQALQPIRDESLLVSFENDEMLDGRTPVVHWAHNHLSHFQKHVCLSFQPAALESPQAMQALQQHLDWHYREFWGLPEGVIPRTDPQYFDRVRVLLGQPAPTAIGPPPMGETPPAGGPQDASGPPSNSSPEAPPASLQPPTPQPEDEGQPQLPSVLQ